jgi:hypothetical protein
MEAWILHIRIQYIEYYPEEHVAAADEYSVWSSEKLALKAAGKYIKTINRWQLQGTLREVANTLVEQGTVNLAIDLLNKYGKHENIKEGTITHQYRHYQINIVKSIFQGSPFE